MCNDSLREGFIDLSIGTSYVMENGTLHNIRCLSFSVVYKCRRIPSYDLTSLSSKLDREYNGIHCPKIE